jgi:uncharacterized protein YbcI
MAGDESTNGEEAKLRTAGSAHPVLARVSREMMRIYKDQFGRGPEFARSHYAGRDTIVCLLSDSLTPVEKTMRNMGEHQRLRDIRMLFQYATEARFRAAVEEATGRKVVSFISGLDVERDIACELFVLAPEDGSPQ